MAALTADLFRNYFGGTWLGKISKNGEFQREIEFNWPSAFNKFSALGTEEKLFVPPNTGCLNNTKQVALAGWRSDVKRWSNVWHNEFGGYGEVQWTSQEVLNGTTIIYGFGHECKQETDDPTDHILMCEMIDQDNFKYTIQSFRKGVTEIEARRLKTGNELKEQMTQERNTMKKANE